MTTYVYHLLSGRLWSVQSNYSVRCRTQRELNESLKWRLRTERHLWHNRHIESAGRELNTATHCGLFAAARISALVDVN